MVLDRCWIFLLSSCIVLALLLNGCEDNSESFLPIPQDGDQNATSDPTSAAPPTPSTTPGNGGGDDDQAFDITGAFTFSLSGDPEVILADEDAREVIEDAAIQTITESAQVSEENVTIDALAVVTSDDGRRLAGEKLLKVDYTISIEDQTEATVANDTMSQMPKSTLKAKLDSAITEQMASLAPEDRAALQSKLGTATLTIAAIGTMELLDFQQTKKTKTKKCRNCKRCKRKCTSTTTIGETPAATSLPRGVTTSLPRVDTTTRGVTTSLPGGDTTTRGDTSTGPALPRNNPLDAQFLMQATFGPTRSTLSALGSGSYADWIRSQMDLPIESHRAYYRERVNPRHPETLQIGKTFGKCDKNSRWSGVAFNKQDLNKAIRVRGNQILVDGVWRTNIDPTGTGNLVPTPTQACTDTPTPQWENRGKTCQAENLKYSCRFNNYWMTNNLQYCRKSCYDQGAGYDGDDCSVGWHNLGDYDGYICDMEDNSVGSWLQLATDSKCKQNLQGMENPAFWMASSSVTPAESTLSFRVAPGKEDLLFLDATPPTCDLTNYVQYSGRYYFYDPRLQLIDNSLGRPATSVVSALSASTDDVDEQVQAETIAMASASSGTVDVCATVPKTFLNENHCKLASTCTPLHLQKATFPLNEESFQKFYTTGNKYLYEVTGLRPEESPCGTLARWVKCTGCAETTTLPEGDIEAIRRALVLQEGRIRDIIAPCNTAAIPAKVNNQPLVVKVDSLYFEYKHLNEHNVYDFTAWVDAHPGGAAEIRKWAGASYNFTLEFPPWHEMTRWSRASTQEQLDFLGKVGDVVDFRSLPSGLQTQELANAFSSEGSSGYFQACGSPFEVANVPAKGHNLAMYTMYDDTKTNYVDTDFDNSVLYGGGGQNARHAKRQVWFMNALHARDQLRQRMAWALSQIFVTSAEGAGKDMGMNEMWINYYDIFIRNGFGNFRDIMREVTYSPLMAVYLTYMQNKALDYDNRFPDENYAREIQQLFTIGLWKLNPDGTKVVKDGAQVPTYDNDDIMNFARVFTGFDSQLPRSNIEKLNRNRNMIDPMQIKELWHDVYPKPDLNDNYLGDGYPLCSDVPPRSFLKQGAEYEFLGYTYDGDDAMIVSTSSKLFRELCRNGADTSNCRYKLKVALSNDVTCVGRECTMDTVRVVKVGLGYFEYVPPTCVHLFFYKGRLARNGGRKFASSSMCANPDTMVAGTSCCKGCTNNPPNQFTRDGLSCETGGTRLTNNCKTSSSWRKNQFCELECWKKNLGYAGLDCSAGDFVEERICGNWQEPVRFSVAQDSCEVGGKEICDRRTSLASCGYDDMNVWTKEACSLAVEIDASGKVSAQTNDKTKQNKVAVQWENGFPEASNCPASCTTREQSCVCDITVEVRQAFDIAPTKAQVEKDLKIGAHTPTIACTSSCAGEVKVYAPSANIDKETVFEVDGRFYKNVQSIVGIPGGYEFRNPPVFTLSGFATQRSVYAEIESLLDHLFHHPNTPTFISYRLIQRFTTSNPSSTYIRDVGDAFKAGEYGGVVYSGKYGDLAATVAAILLHPEARNPGASGTIGQLREPVLKLVHFLRALEYQDNNNRELLFLALDEKTGQAPYKSPTVFNYYFVDYQPPRFSGSLVAPEFQIFTPPYWLNFLNAMVSLIDYGLSSCNTGFGARSRSCYDRLGSFQLGESATVDETLTQLDLLLTGGRSTSMSIIRDAYDSADAGKGFQAAQKAIVMSPEFNVMGPSLPGNPRPEVSPTPSVEPTSYKAAVLLWMGGGADTFNMLVPLGCNMHTQYMEARTNVALTPDQLIEISADNQVCTRFGIHQGLPILQELYNQGQAAFVSNIGPLVEPTNKYNFKTGARRCVGLFSHSDQVNAAQTLQCQVPGTSPKGVGGRLGDALAGSSKVTSFSISGTSTWSEGVRTHTEIIDKSKGAVQFREYQELKYVIGNITSKVHRNVYAEEFSQQFREFITSSERLGAIFEQANLRTPFETTGKLGDQLKQVARLISVRDLRKAERDLFYVNIGGFDSHSNVAQILTDNFAEIESALRLFVTELKADPDGAFDKTVIFSQSDFGRTLTSNGPGTDHGWAGNHFVIGGKLNGGKIFNEFPTSFVDGNDQDAGRGRLIPKFPWESMMVPIAQWMGLDKTLFNEVFPNLGNFNTTKHIIPTSALFKS